MELIFELDPDEIVKWEQSKQQELPQRAYRLTFDVTNDVRNGMIDEGPVRCGFNKNSHVADIISWNYGLAYSDAPYYPTIIKGRGPVVAVRAKALAIRTSCHGGVIFRKRAGPAKANDYRPRAIQKAQSDMKSHMEDFAKWYAT